MADVISERGKKKLVYNRYIFWRDGQSSDGKITFWRCSNRYKSFCKARVHTVDGLVTKELHEHSHLQEERHVQIAKVRTVVKERAATANDMSTPANIISDATVGLPGAVRAHIVEKNVKRTIQRTRLRTAAAPANPQNCEDLEIPDSYKHILLDDARGLELFLQYDSGAEENRILIFGTEESKRVLELSENWQADGTFKVTPPIFAQVYSIHASRHGDLVPAFYCLLTNKAQETYERLFRAVRQLIPNAHPTSFLVDFEISATNAIRMVFEYDELTVSGCFFHLNENVRKHMQQIGLQRRYQNDPEFALLLRHIPALAFVPIQHLIEAFETLEEVIPDEMLPLLDYFERTYIGRRLRARRRDPPYSHDFWNVHVRVSNGDARTNNKVEGHHNLINKMLSMQHPTIWKFIEALRKLQNINKNKIEALCAQGPPAKRRKYKDLDARLKTIVEDFANRDILDFLRGIAHNLQFVQ